MAIFLKVDAIMGLVPESYNPPVPQHGKVQKDGNRIGKTMDAHESVPADWKHSDCEILRTVYWEERCALAEKLLKHVFTKKEIGRACHIHDLEAKVKHLQREITNQREAAEYRNRQLKATNLIVLCSGGCEGGILGSQDKVDEELVSDVETIAQRLRSWFANHNSRVQNGMKQ